MTESIDELNELVKCAKWFSALGEFSDRSGFIAIRNLDPWALNTSSSIADEMDWLPTSRDQRDPFNGNSLRELACSSGKEEELRRDTMKVYQTALASLRSVLEHPLLKVGPHDFNIAAKGAAQFACRAAATEIVMGQKNRWCNVIELYASGYWPCGVLRNNIIVVL